MAKTEGEQTIPCSLRDAYRAALAEQKPDLSIEKRYPYRMPTKQDKKGVPTPGQRIQRARFKTVIGSFNALSQAEKTRWYGAMPEWGSLLWYYNFFMLSGLMDVLGADARGAQVIKRILNRTLEIPIAGTTITHATTVDASKVVVMLWGAAYNFDEAQVGEYPYAWAWPIYPIWGTLGNTNISLTWSIDPHAAGKAALQVIEYI